MLNCLIICNIYDLAAYILILSFLILYPKANRIKNEEVEKIKSQLTNEKFEDLKGKLPSYSPNQHRLMELKEEFGFSDDFVKAYMRNSNTSLLFWVGILVSQASERLLPKTCDIATVCDPSTIEFLKYVPLSFAGIVIIFVIKDRDVYFKNWSKYFWMFKKK
ncbi:MAG: hypothetical protein KC478_13770 [Bacteriovoracaceae bacterium]|nr:hypothetical protein [Bacteriovoracaceae bacterium]